MDKFQLHLAQYNYCNRPKKLWRKSFSELMTFTRRFTNIKIDHLQKDESQFLKQIIEIHGNYLSQISFYYCHILFSDVLKLLNLTSNIKTLKMEKVFLEGELNTQVSVNALDSLKEVTILSHGFKILDYINATKVEKLKIDICESDMEYLIPFLQNQSKLQTLAIIFDSHQKSQPFLNNKAYSFSFQLKKFTCNFGTYIDSESLMNFLKLHSKTLRQMKIESSVPDIMFKQIICKLNQLNHLTINAKHIPSDKTFYKYLIPSQSIQTLIVNDKLNDIRIGKLFLNLFPNLKSITLTKLDERIFAFMETYHKKLERISMIRMTYIYALQHPSFPKLKRLFIDHFLNISKWICFLLRNPSVETLHLKEIYLGQINLEAVKSLTTMQNIKHIKLQGGLKAMKEFLQHIRIVGYNNLESMEIIVQNLYENFSHPFYFSFPRDKKINVDLTCPYLDDFNC